MKGIPESNKDKDKDVDMIRFFSFMAVAVALLLPRPAEAQCRPSKAWLNFEQEYNDWREHRKKRMHKRHGRCGGKKPHRRGHGRMPPPDLPPPCMICINQVQTKPVRPAKPKAPPVDKGFCKIKNNEYRSKPFELGGLQHVLSLVILDNKLLLELTRFNETSNISDDSKYIAVPKGFTTPAVRSSTPLASFPEKAQKESMKMTCNNTRSITWSPDSELVTPAFFGGKIDLVYTEEMIYTQSSFSTDLSTTAFMDIILKPVKPNTTIALPR